MPTNEYPGYAACVHGVMLGVYCWQCQLMLPSAAPAVPVAPPVTQGWQCPVCFHVFAPSVAECTHCPMPVEITTTSTTAGGTTVTTPAMPVITVKYAGTLPVDDAFVEACKTQIAESLKLS